MKVHKLLWIFVVVLAFGCSTAEENQNLESISTTAPIKTVDIDEIIAKLETAIPELMDSNTIPGLSIALIGDGEIKWQHGFGVKNTDTGDPVTEDTIFEAASLSKPVFAYAVLILVDEGKIDLDTPLVTYALESYIEEKYLGRKIDDDRFRQITARMVLTHSTGFPNWRGNNPLTIIFTPGERFSYSGEGFVYLQRIVEHITGKPLADFMQESVLGPLGMSHSSYIWRDEYETQAASRHNLLGKSTGVSKSKRGSAAASLKTTAGDYAKFLLALLEGTGLKKETLEAMMKPQIETSFDNAEDISWGLGIGLQKTSDGIAFWHWGDNGDTKAFTITNRESGRGLIYFANSSNGLAIAGDIVNLVMGDQPVLATSLMKEYFVEDTPMRAFMQKIVKNGVDNAIDYFHDLTGNDPSQKEYFTEGALNNLGYTLLNSDEITDAIKILKLNTELYPESANVYDSLGEAYMKSGDKENAIKFYKKALEINPEFPSSLQALKQLEGNN